MLTSKTRGQVGVSVTAWGLPKHWLLGSEELFSLPSLACLGFISLSLVFSFSLKIIIIIIIKELQTHHGWKRH